MDKFACKVLICESKCVTIVLDYIIQSRRVPSVLAMMHFVLYHCFNTKLEHLLFILCLNTLESG